MLFERMANCSFIVCSNKPPLCFILSTTHKSFSHFPYVFYLGNTSRKSKTLGYHFVFTKYEHIKKKKGFGLFFCHPSRPYPAGITFVLMLWTNVKSHKRPKKMCFKCGSCGCFNSNEDANFNFPLLQIYFEINKITFKRSKMQIMVYLSVFCFCC